MNIDLHWQSDWNGDEVGFPEVDVVGLYSFETADQESVFLYIDTSTRQVLHCWKWGEEVD